MTRGKATDYRDIPMFVAEGLTPAEVASRLGCTPGWAVRLMRKAGYKAPPIPPKLQRQPQPYGIIAHHHSAVMEMFQAGHADGHIAKQIGVSREAVRRYREKQGIASISPNSKGLAGLGDWRNFKGVRPANTQNTAPEMVRFDSYAGVAFLDDEPVQPGAVDGMQRMESPWFAAQVWVR